MIIPICIYRNIYPLSSIVSHTDLTFTALISFPNRDDPNSLTFTTLISFPNGDDPNSQMLIP